MSCNIDRAGRCCFQKSTAGGSGGEPSFPGSSLALGPGMTMCNDAALEHDLEKGVPIFRKDHAPPKIESAMTIQLEVIAL
jgi:hypothetical protein